MTTPTFTSVVTVTVPVTDQDRARALFERLGWEATADAELQPVFRWIDMTPPGGGTSVSVLKAAAELPAGVDTGIRFAAADARAAHATLGELGLDVGELLDWESAPLMFSFADADGNRFYVVETT